MNAKPASVQQLASPRQQTYLAAMSTSMIPLLLAVASAAAQPDPMPEAFLAGGALRTCSDLAPKACGDRPERAGMRLPARYRVDAEGIERALVPALWAAKQAPSRASLQQMLESAVAKRRWSYETLTDRLAEYCDRPCASDADHPWTRLLDRERAALLSALEIPQIIDSTRARERAHLQDSREQAGVSVLQAFVAAAAQRADERKVRIAVVTASASDPFEPVDFYLDSFSQLGAEARWWPLDAALRASVEANDCANLDQARQRELGQAGRERVYADLASLQRQYCEQPQRLSQLPEAVDGVFFAGGDQWGHRRAFYSDSGAAMPWLTALRRAHAAGRLVVGGTSAGSAVQSGAAMVSNGTADEGLRQGAIAASPPQPGCDRAQRCAVGLNEASLTYWPAGGLGLLQGWSVDTHFSERGRELRMLRLLHDSDSQLGVGIDETSALHFRADGNDGWRIEAIGANGGWVFERLESESATLAARVHYLVSGQSVRIAAPNRSSSALAPELPQSPTPPEQAADALESGALRQAAQQLARGQAQSLRLSAANGVALLARTSQSRIWRSASGSYGITSLYLQWQPDTASAAEDQVVSVPY